MYRVTQPLLNMGTGVTEGSLDAGGWCYLSGQRVGGWQHALQSREKEKKKRRKRKREQLDMSSNNSSTSKRHLPPSSLPGPSPSSSPSLDLARQPWTPETCWPKPSVSWTAPISAQEVQKDHGRESCCYLNHDSLIWPPPPRLSNCIRYREQTASRPDEVLTLSPPLDKFLGAHT